MGKGASKSLDFKAVREAAIEALSEIPDDRENVFKKDFYAKVYSKYYDKTGHTMHYNNYIPIERLYPLISEEFLNNNGWKSCKRKVLLSPLEGNHNESIICITRLLP